MRAPRAHNGSAMRVLRMRTAARGDDRLHVAPAGQRAEQRRGVACALTDRAKLSRRGSRRRRRGRCERGGLLGHRGVPLAAGGFLRPPQLAALVAAGLPPAAHGHHQAGACRGCELDSHGRPRPPLRRHRALPVLSRYNQGRHRSFDHSCVPRVCLCVCLLLQACHPALCSLSPSALYEDLCLYVAQ